jgi:predicted DNA-binding helix-hairpin-helix protein
MNDSSRLAALTDFMEFELSEDREAAQAARTTGCGPACGSSTKSDPQISTAVLPNGQRMRLLKTLISSACERNCFYCPFRAGRDFRRETFKPDEMARTFMTLQRGGVAQGLFLSSGVAGGSRRTQDQILAATEILRKKYQYRGYVHLKLMPGVERAQVEQAMRLADRVSVNLEAPNTERLQALAPGKAFLEELLQPLRWIHEIRRNSSGSAGWKGHWPSTTTQFVIGAVGESDLELLSTTQNLYRQFGLARAYYSAFTPVVDTPFENLPAEMPQREHHLYQASFLLRDYGFDLEELPFNAAGSLPQTLDPKLAWAQSNLVEAPVELNQADEHQLLRVPGIGPKGARSILNARQIGRLHSLDDLSRMGINFQRSAPFILLDGRRPARQLALF